VDDGSKRALAEMGPLKNDITSNERHIRRSQKIRAGVYAFLRLQVGQVFEDEQEIADMCCNSIKQKPNPETCKRWIGTLTSRNGPFELSPQPAGLVVRLREVDNE
jgi:hypothetical protein